MGVCEISLKRYFCFTPPETVWIDAYAFETRVKPMRELKAKLPFLTYAHLQTQQTTTNNNNVERIISNSDEAQQENQRHQERRNHKKQQQTTTQINETHDKMMRSWEQRKATYHKEAQANPGNTQPGTPGTIFRMLINNKLSCWKTFVSIGIL